MRNEKGRATTFVVLALRCADVLDVGEDLDDACPVPVLLPIVGVELLLHPDALHAVLSAPGEFGDAATTRGDHLLRADGHRALLLPGRRRQDSGEGREFLLRFGRAQIAVLRQVVDGLDHRTVGVSHDGEIAVDTHEHEALLTENASGFGGFAQLTHLFLPPLTVADPMSATDY